ncbi:ATP-dependent helicase [Methanocella arvoryzae]|uniref:DNA 3'-5' helicase n=1 Tax=Methanocella arvoryzae (strain DSM 22066 / NBRC 105507 / MRE50) TaxID=351160 RepID=Q0W8K9_METAR|nr:ATP-dependent DNA helicase [Methanocella arvoryzae]CAH04821.1 ATP-dependent DNA helicase [uncultured archaeon]CAJ35284.1 putative ATP-dependent DNA helicase [Methanocella arvoryzae MRE50]
MDFFSWFESTTGKPLNDRQKDAVRCDTGAVLVSAGAGTGKTTMITAKAAYLIKEKSLKPERLLMLTFSRDAAAHMKEEIEKVVPEARDATANTFHAFCLDILVAGESDTGIDERYRLLDEKDGGFILCKEAGVPPRLASHYITSIQRAKDMGLTWADYEGYLGQLEASMREICPEEDIESAAGAATVRLRTEQFKDKQAREEKKKITEFLELFEEYKGYLKFLEAWKKYEQIKAQKLLLDYADMIRLTIDYARARGHEVLADKFDYVIVDEFQDTNRQQYELLKILAGDGKGITVVGDVNQSIYGFRGAYPENIDTFKEEYRPATFDLTENYRSTDSILRTAYRLIRNNYQKADDARLLQAFDHREGTRVMLLKTLNQNEQARRIVEEIDRLLAEGVAPEEIAVLFRSYSSLRPIEAALKQRAIPYQVSTTTGFLKRPEIRTALAYLYVLASLEMPRHGADQLWYKLLQYRYGVSIRDVHLLSAAAKRDSIQGVLTGSLPRGLSEEGRVKIRHLVDRIMELRASTNKELPDLLLDIYELSGLSREFTHDNSSESKTSLLNLKALHDIVTGFQDLYGTDLQGFIEYVELLDEIGDDGELPRQEKAGGVVLKTCHGAKGLEYSHVFVVDLAKDKFPLSRGGREPLVPDQLNDRYADVFSLPEAEIEEALKKRKQDFKLKEERRLAYVAFTRAKDRLYLCYPASYGESERPPSMFIAEACYNSGELHPDMELVEDAEEKAAVATRDSDLDRKKNEIKRQILSTIDSEPDLALYNLLLYQHLCGRPIAINCPQAAMAGEEAAVIRAELDAGIPRGMQFDPKEVRLSYSGLKTYEECPKKYELQYLLNIPSRTKDSEGESPLSFGNYIHKTLELAVKQQISTREELDAIAEKTSLLPDFAGVDKDKAKRIFDVFWARNKDTIRRSVGVEQFFNFTMDGFQFTGKIDRVDQLSENGDAEIIDYKTGREPGTEDRERQITMYMLALQRDPALREKRLTPKRATLELLEEEKPRTFELCDDGTMKSVGSNCKAIEIEKVRQWFVQMANNIAYDYEHGFEVIEECGQVGYTGNCPYKMYCPRWG